ncbi:GGDEF domain-containing response regulator [Paenibacillus agricola]|uniref:Diguanylate cyclase n=1 Tax=Paenibacillus agricola TaxID=2716264 RepID=A0ABX0JJH1_9BACL|nr:diguanylate cyclase [Paenibacillus agricola]NHN35599.1 diguanylate cyclase [Paenibacillus agricola]
MKSSVDRLLIIDDDADLRNLLLKRFRQSDLEIDEASDVATAKRKLYEHTYDLIILDLVMYPESGYTLFELLKEDVKLKWIPLIVLSGSNDIEDKVKCLELGADDYVTKPFQFKELKARVSRLLSRARQFEQLAFRDPLTGIYNRRYFNNHLSVELQRVQRYPSSVSLALLDIDRFKSINDKFGHPVGDQVLKGLTKLLKANLCQTDLLARYGGEEFIVLLLDTKASEASIVIDEILQKLRILPFSYTDQIPAFTFSAGIAQWEPGLNETEWIHRADQQLYEAKQKGRNKVLIWQ